MRASVEDSRREKFLASMNRVFDGTNEVLKT